MDPLAALTTALNLPADSPEQVQVLSQLSADLEQQPASIPVLVTTFLPNVVSSKDSAFKRWVIDLLHFGVSRSSLTPEVKLQMATQSLESLLTLLGDPTPASLKASIQCLANVYPLIFRASVVNRVRGPWDAVLQAKNRIVMLFQNAGTSTGIKISAVKFIQRVILVHHRGITDPRLQNKGDPSISLVPPEHPFINAKEMEHEGSQLLKEFVTVLYTSNNPEIITAILNSFGAIIKSRPSTITPLVKSLVVWTPKALVGQSASVIKTLEAARKRNQSAPPDTDPQMAKRIRTDGAVQDPNASPRAPSASTAQILTTFDFTSLPVNVVTDLVIASLKAVSAEKLNSAVAAYRVKYGPPPSAPEPSTSAVQVKQEEVVVDPLKVELDEDELQYEPERLNQDLDLEGDEQPGAEGGTEDAEGGDDAALVPLRLVEFDLPPPRMLTEEERSVEVHQALKRIRGCGEETTVMVASSDEGPPTGRSIRGLPSSEAWILFMVRLATRGPGAGVTSNTAIDEDGMDVEHDDEETSDAKGKGKDVATSGGASSFHSDKIRQMLCDFVMEDFPARLRVATIWMNEEWFNDTIRTERDPNWQPQYDIWIRKLLAAQMHNIDGKDKTLTRFLIDLPSLPSNALFLLRDICTDADIMPVGFNSLRELVSLRPPVRSEAMKILLDLTTHPEKVTRGAAIITVRRWVPDHQPMDDMIRAFALRMLKRLETNPKVEPPQLGLQPAPESGAILEPASTENAPAANGSVATDEDKEDANPPDDAMTDVETSAPTEDVDIQMTDVTIQPAITNTPPPLVPLSSDVGFSSYLSDELEFPVEKTVVLQHIELLLALSVKVPDFLDDLFQAYGQMDSSVQDAIKELITQLIKTLGPNNGKLLTLLRTFPYGAESLALRVLAILTENGRPTPPLVALVKSLIAERQLDPRFLITIIGEMDKADIVRNIPRIVGMLNGKPEERDMVRKVFSNIVTEAPSGASTNMPRVRQSERLAPAELMVLLHESEKEIGLKSTIEAIGICFSMTEVFRMDVLAVVMQQIVDEPTLPTLFMRTVIQAVTTYKNLVNFVTTTLFSRLIVKKIWTIPALWEGFIRCAKITAPASFGALLQLPKDQLREVVDKQPSLKSGLREHVLKKAGSKAKVAAFLEVFGDAPETNPSEGPSAAVTPGA
ncbi:hypothetical protein FRC02_008439 [Tulasnella sp. 418]|nr:hypothetical protein FRC02_008439 [Tulasnella sp. 418]